MTERRKNISTSTNDEINYVRNRLIEFNAQHIPANIEKRYEEVNLTVKDDLGKIIGGVMSVICWNWMEIDILWVDQDYRGQGYGTHLMAKIENIAKQKDCTFIQLNTFSFQAPDFYQKHGYKIFGVIENAPPGFTHYYFKKEI